MDLFSGHWIYLCFSLTWDFLLERVFLKSRKMWKETLSLLWFWKEAYGQLFRLWISVLYLWGINSSMSTSFAYLIAVSCRGLNNKRMPLGSNGWHLFYLWRKNKLNIDDYPSIMVTLYSCLAGHLERQVSSNKEQKKTRFIFNVLSCLLT